MTHFSILHIVESAMGKWLTSLFLLFALAYGVLAGTPLHAGNTDSGMMACCDKAKNKEQSSEANAARVCCAVNCTDPAPISQGGSFNFAPASVEISRSDAGRISTLLQKEKIEFCVSFQYSQKVYPRKFQPKYIQNNSFLI